MESVAVPVLVRVTVFGALETLTLCGPNDKTVFENEAAGAPTTTCVVGPNVVLAEKVVSPP